MQINRRKFLETSGLILAGSFVSSAGIPEPQKRSAVKSIKANDAKVRALLSQMTLEEKVGQMIQANQASLKDPSDVEKYFLGSLLSGGSSDPKTGNGLIDWTDHYDSLQSRTQNTRLRIPILYGIDAVHGHSNVLGATLFPHNIGLGCTRNPQLVERAARITAISRSCQSAPAHSPRTVGRCPPSRVTNVGVELTKALAKIRSLLEHSVKLQCAGTRAAISMIL